jgi:hypothetical protein
MRTSRTRPNVARAGALLVGVIGAFTIAHTAGQAWAHPIDVWVHDHSSDVIRPRPDGLSEIQATFGPVCGDNSNGARSYWPAQDANGAGYVYYDTYVGKNVGGNIRNHVLYDRKDGAVRWLVGGYNCRYISGTTSWSLHAWGAAIDTNSATNPVGQDHWNGLGADGKKYGTYLPDVWRGPYPGHHFFWGLSWPTKPDPMHFQYATGY